MLRRGTVTTIDDQGRVVFGSDLYSPDAADGATEAAVAASLGCGIPTAVADLHPGEIGDIEIVETHRMHTHAASAILRAHKPARARQVGNEPFRDQGRPGP